MLGYSKAFCLLSGTNCAWLELRGGWKNAFCHSRRENFQTTFWNEIQKKKERETPKDKRDSMW